MTLVEAVKKMRGPKGSKVTLISIKREGINKLFDVTLTREVIKIQSVKSKWLEKGYGYVRVTQFQERTDNDVERTLDSWSTRDRPSRASSSTSATIPAVSSPRR